MTEETGWRRRRLLAAVAAGALTGCQSSSQAEDGSTPTATAGHSPTAVPPTRPTPDPTATPEPTETPDSTETPKEPSCSRFADPANWVVWEGTARTVREGTRNACGLELRCKPPAERIAAMYEFESPRDMSTTHLTVPVTYPAAVAPDVLEVWLAAPTLQRRYEFDLRPRPGGGRIEVALSTPDRTVGSPDPSTVTGIKYIQHTTDGSRFTVEQPRQVPRGPDTMVVFTFDGGRSAVAETAFPILADHGFSGSVGVVDDRVGESGFCSVDQLRTLSRRGWNVVSQPLRGRPLTSLSTPQRTARIEENARWLRDHGFDDGARFMLYPTNDWDEETLEIVAQHHTLGFAGSGVTTWQPPMPARVRRVRATEPATVTEYLTRLEQFWGVLVLAVPDIGEGADALSPEGLRGVVEAVDAAGISVATVGEWETARSG